MNQNLTVNFNSIANFSIKQVVGIGNAIVDLTIKISDSDFTKLASLGIILPRGSMTLVDYHQLAKILSLKSPFYSTAGGSVANSLKIIASTNIEGSFIGSVANDDFGVKFSNSLANFRCKFYNYYQDSELANQSAVCAVLIDDKGERTMATYLGCAGKIANLPLNLDNYEDGKIFYLEGYLWDNDATIATIANWLKTIKKQQNLIAFSLSDAFCVKRKQQDFLQIITESADIIFANHLEILSLLDLEDFSLSKIANFCNSFPNKIFAITCGGDGAYIFHRGQFIHSPAISEIEVVDLTGAGDAFAAGLIYGLIRGKELSVTAKIANIFASKVIARFGSELDRETIESILQSID